VAGRTVASLTPAQIEAFHEDGFLTLSQYLAGDDMERLLRVARADRALSEIANDRLDSEGRVSRLSLRYDLDGDDAYRAYARHEGIVGPVEQLLGTEAYHYHHKMMMKEPRTGGAWEWHQDFGYWYANFLMPDMISCMIAVDRATKANGCLQVLRGSHRMGRIDHGRTGDQTGADLERIAALEDRFDLVHCEMEPGTALFFHSNTLHRSDPNESPDPRWALICCYTATHNPPFRPETRGDFSAFERWNDERVRAAVAEHDARLSAAAAG
jgi:ectoine hydroxylase